MISMSRNKESEGRREVEADENGLKVFNIEKAPLSGKEKRILIDEIDWEDDKMEIEMVVNGIKPELDKDGKKLEKLILDISEIGIKEEEKIDEFWKKVEKELGIRKKGDEIEFNEDKSAKYNLVDFVNYLFQNGYLKAEDIPISSGYKRYLINTEAKNKKGEEMYHPVELKNGMYLETNLNKMQIKNKIIELGDKLKK